MAKDAKSPAFNVVHNLQFVGSTRSCRMQTSLLAFMIFLMHHLFSNAWTCLSASFVSVQAFKPYESFDRGFLNPLALAWFCQLNHNFRDHSDIEITRYNLGSIFNLDAGRADDVGTTQRRLRV